MSKRDLKADLEICNKATEGPWEHKYGPEFSEIYANDSNTPLAVVGHNPHDADFIVHARDGWSHTIERAIEAEEQIEELKGLLKEAKDLIGLASYFATDGDTYSDYFMEFDGRQKTLDTKIREMLGDD